jgi:hypothetical protein
MYQAVKERLNMQFIGRGGDWMQPAWKYESYGLLGNLNEIPDL